MEHRGGCNLHIGYLCLAGAARPDSRVAIKPGTIHVPACSVLGVMKNS